MNIEEEKNFTVDTVNHRYTFEEMTSTIKNHTEKYKSILNKLENGFLIYDILKCLTINVLSVSNLHSQYNQLLIFNFNYNTIISYPVSPQQIGRASCRERVEISA